tara:strand:- start:626 stop:1384 length:759 start_codon:yes stop_codon:yes gene_type:complete
VCNARGQTINSLLRKSKAPAHTYDAISGIYKKTTNFGDKTKSNIIVTLPQEYEPLYVAKSNPHYRNALHYAVNKRNLSYTDIVKYEIGYCESGPYGGMLIVPNYNDDGFLDYYVGRSFYDTDIKHKNPAIPKDVIGFASHINWREPITIVEGAYDAISTKRNAIPLFGKKILPKLRSRILHERPPQLNLAFDPDAYKDSLEEIEYFINNGINIRYTDLQCDPNETGHIGMLNAIKDAKEITFFDLIKYKMNI